MKILIAYDGSQSSDAAVDDLALAGLPAAGTALVVSVAEAWLPPAENGNTDHRDLDESVPPETRVLAAHAKKRVENLLPGWQVDAEAASGSPAAEVLAKAEEFVPDLILVGPQGRSSLGRFALGSTSQKVLTEARASVRIGRGRIEINGAPARLIVAFDGSEGALAAVRAVAARRWPAGSEVRIVSVAERLGPSAIGRFIAPAENNVETVSGAELVWLESQAEKAIETLKPLGVAVSFEVIPGSARQILIEEAARWDADCIFMGADKSASLIERPILGTTSAAVAARASSSVEIVRTRY